MKKILFFSGLLLSLIMNAQPWKDLSDSAKFYQDKRINAKSADFYEKAIDELKKDSAGTATYTSHLHRLGILYFGMGKYDKTGPLLEEVRQLRIKLVGKRHIDYARSTGNLGQYYSTIGKYDMAEPLLIECRDSTAKILGKENGEYANVTGNLGLFYKNTGHFEKAEPFYMEALKVREKVFGKEHADYALSVNNFGAFYQSVGMYEKADTLYNEALHIRERLLGRENPSFAASLNNVAILYRIMGRFNEAEKLYLESMQIRERTLGREHPEFAGSLNNLAVLYWATGQFEKVERLHLECIQLREKIHGKNSYEYTQSNNNLATFYKDMGQYAKAEKMYVDNIEIQAKVLGRNHPEYAMCVNNLAILYMKLRQFEKAEPYFLEAKQVREKVLSKNHPEYANSCDNLGIMYSEMRQFEKAKPLLEEAKQVYEKIFGNDHPEYASSSMNLAGLYMDEGKFSLAEPLLLEAQRINANSLGKTNIDYIISTGNLAVLYWGLKDYRKAKEYFAEAIRAKQDNLKYIFRFASEKEKANYIKELEDIDQKMTSFALATGSLTEQGFLYDLSLSNRNAILSSSQQIRQAIINSGDPALVTKYDDWIKTREQLVFWLSKPVEARSGRDSVLEAKANALEQDLTRLSADFKKGQQEIRWKMIQQSLRPGEAAVEFTEFQYHNGKKWVDSIYYAALILTKEKEPELVYLFEKRQLDSILLQTGTSYNNSIDKLYTSSSLYNLVWKPVASKLHSISKIYFAAAGELHLVNFAAIWTGENKTLSDKHKLIGLNSTASVVNNKNETISTPDKILLYGGIIYAADSSSLIEASRKYSLDGSLASRSATLTLAEPDEIPMLPNTEMEVDAIANNARKHGYSTTVIKGLDANEESVKSTTNNQTASIFHFATHGFFNPNAIQLSVTQSLSGGKAFMLSDDPLMRSGLMLAGANNIWSGKPLRGVQDGILTGYEISNLYLPNTKLVVLSACETGLGKVEGSEGVNGLQRAFKMAGVQNLIMSLWRIPDNTTAEFMQVFYEKLFAKKSISEAFDEAQALIKNKYKTEPHKWAGLILVQ
jgi:CHAT domain-containing protein/Flp pilus assembly protein TadD